MTDSREAVRRKDFAARARHGTERTTRLSTLCIVRGCLDPRVGSNLCAYHDRVSTRLAEHQGWADA